MESQIIIDSEQLEWSEFVIKTRNPVWSIPKFLKDSESGKPIIMAPIHNNLQEFLTNNNTALAVLPRSHGKSEQTAVGRAAFEIGNNPHVRIAIVSESMEVATQRVEAVKNIIMSKEYQELYPDIKPSRNNWGTQSFTVKRDYVITGPTMMAFGIRTAVTGFRFDIVICDDVCGEECQTSGALRKLIIKKFENTIVNLLKPGGKLWMIGTFWHLHDLTKKIFDEAPNNGFETMIEPINDNLEPIWEYWSTERLIERRKTIGIRAFELNYQLKAKATEDIIFREEDLKACIRKGDPIIAENIDNTWIRVMGVDLAIKEKTTSHYTVIMVWAINPKDGCYVPIEVIRMKASSPVVTRKIIELQEYWHCDLILVEGNAYQEAVVQWSKDQSMKLIPIQGETSRQDKITKASIMAVDFEHRKMRIYLHRNPFDRMEEPCDCSWCSWVQEMKDFPNGDFDDTIDGAWFARTAALQLVRPQQSKPKWGEIKIAM